MARPLRIDRAGAWHHVMMPCEWGYRFNRAHRRRGHVFQGRFKSVLILDGSRLDEAAARPEWEAMVKAAEGIVGREWRELVLRHGDWGRDGLLAVATRHLGWRLGEVVGREPGVSYAGAAQGIRRFWQRAPNSPEMQA